MPGAKMVIIKIVPTTSEYKYERCNAFIMFTFDMRPSAAGPAHVSNFKSQCGAWGKQFTQPWSRVTKKRKSN